MFEQARVNWITSSERTTLLNGLHRQITDCLVAAFPGVPVSPMANELVAVALREVDAIIAKPVQVNAHTIVIKDHRG